MHAIPHCMRGFSFKGAIFMHEEQVGTSRKQVIIYALQISMYCQLILLYIDLLYEWTTYIVINNTRILFHIPTMN
jgi:hypothetical protein